MNNLEDEDKALRSWYLQSRHEFVARVAIRMAGGAVATVLDAGCSTGGVSLLLRRAKVHVTGCDLNPKAISVAKAAKRIDEGCAADICAMPFPDNTFDLVVCSEVLEHVPDDRLALREILRVSRGPVFVSVPAHGCLWTESDELLGHQRRYSRDALAALMNDCGAHFDRINAFGALPGVMLLGYRFVSSFERQSGSAKTEKPLAVRFTLPRWADRTLYFLSSIELAIGERGLMPWGHAWWTIATKQSHDRGDRSCGPTRSLR